MKHEGHTKQRMYARNQMTKRDQQWQSTEIFLCSCGAILEKQFVEKKTESFTEEGTLPQRTKKALSENE